MIPEHYRWLVRALRPGVLTMALVAMCAPGVLAQGNPSGAVATTGPTVALPHDLSPWGMFIAADLVVKAVMIGLAAASVMVWSIWIAKSLQLMVARRALRLSRAALGAETSLLAAESALPPGSRLAQAFIAATLAEVRLSADAPEKAGIQDRAASRVAEIETAAGRAIRSGIGFLATVGATGPFVGLFGTVWGIMNSFIGISRTQTTNLAVVAPGIAEALLATAIGLVAAIPAVILYNQLARSIAGYRALVRENASEVLRLLSRDLDRRGSNPAHRIRAAE
jgi:biopolymer transport protein ExbB